MDSGYSILSYNEDLENLKNQEMYDFYKIDEDFRITFIPFTQEDTFSKNYEYWKTILTNELEQLVVSIKGKISQFRLRQKRNQCMWFH